MLATNEDRLVEMAVVGEVAPPRMGSTPYRVSPEGDPIVLPGTGGITYNVRVGDPATGWMADHVEPGVSVENRERDAARNASAALNVLACVGNAALVVTGKARGGRGVVTGKHGGVDHVLVDFPSPVLEDLSVGDRVLIRARGLGLALRDFPGVRLFNVAPDLLGRMGLRTRKKRLVVPVAAVVPAAAMGSGIGATHCYSGDYDIQMTDRGVVEAQGLDRLRLGDIVAIPGADHRFGRSTMSGALAVGVVVHTQCVTPGHGPGVTTLMASTSDVLEFEVRKDANIAHYLRIGRARREAHRRSL